MSTQSPEQSTSSNQPIGPKMENKEFYFRVPHSKELVSPDAPTGEFDERRVADLIKQGLPENASAIDPMTGKVEYIPLSQLGTSEQSTTEESTDEQPATEETPDAFEKQKATKKSKKGLLIGLGSAGAALAVATGAFMLRGDSTSPEEPQKLPSASGAPTPGPSPSETTPEATPPAVETPVGAAERQNEIFKKLSITSEMLPKGYFNEYVASEVDPDGLAIYTGPNGLVEDFKAAKNLHQAAVGNTTPEDMAEWQKLYEEVLEAKYTTIIDGKPVKDLSAAEMFAESGYMVPMSVADYERWFKDFDVTTKKAQAAMIANDLAVVDTKNVYGAVAEAVTARESVKEYNLIHSDDQLPPSIVNPSAIAQLRYMDPNSKTVINAVERMTDPGRIHEPTPVPLEGKSFIVTAYDLPPVESSDGSTSMRKEAVTIFAEYSDGYGRMKTYVPVPISEHVATEMGRPAWIEKDVTNKYVYVNVLETTHELGN